MTRLVFDIETDGLYFDVSQVHCVVTKDIDTGEIKKFEPCKVEQALQVLTSADLLIGHNVIAYDLAVLSKLYPAFTVKREQVTDTLTLSRLLYSDLGDRDREAVAKGVLGEEFPSKLTGSHSLKAWGLRLGELKAEYEGGWEAYSDEMLEYCVQDVEVACKLYAKLSKHEAFSERASQLEHDVQWIIAQQERHGFRFDEAAAEKLTARLTIRRGELARELETTFPPWEESELFIPKANNKRYGYEKGVPIRKVKKIVFNPNSRHHIANRLSALYGWKPTEMTPEGSAKIDETILSKLEYPEAEKLAEYFMVQKRIGALAEGANAWQKLVRNGRIHGEVITNGAVTGRATHRKPNVAQTPAIKVPYGKECRDLFKPDAGKVLVGVDVSGLELRMLAHFMSAYDDGAYSKEVVDGDVHTANRIAAGLETRDQAKTFIYAFLYGAGPSKIGSIIGKGAKDGTVLKQRFLEKTPALNKLIRGVQSAAGRGYLVGLDGRRLHIRSDHAALNTLLQSGGALVCKQWMVAVDAAIKEQGWQDRVHQVAWIHDECQYSCDPEIADEFGKLSIKCIEKAGHEFKIRTPLTGEYKVGSSWAETH